MRQEAFCAPPLLRYEMVRGVNEDILHRKRAERDWMDWAVVDARPFLYYLQYLTFRSLGHRDRQMQAFINLYNCLLGPTLLSHLYHRETYIHFLGHCWEMEGRPDRALVLYRISGMNCYKRNLTPPTKMIKQPVPQPLGVFP